MGLMSKLAKFVSFPRQNRLTEAMEESAEVHKERLEAARVRLRAHLDNSKRSADQLTDDLVLAKLSAHQIALAKEANGSRKQITHVLLCGKYGQIFGTEKHCWKYYSAWSDIFRPLFRRAYEVNLPHPVPSYESTFNLVVKLLDAMDRKG
jgi:hypothetical protein